jgi:pantoate--beta-alanine ligase
MTVGFVPTMGYLHQGHIALIRRARRENHRVVVSVFVNPLQFGPKEDYTRYPRDEVRDVRLCRDAGCDWFFIPRTRSLYPPGFSTSVTPGPLAERWEGAVRPGHFRGVATVVLKLMNLAEPDTLYLGRKDVQQASVVRAMVRDLDNQARVAIVPTVRDRDGLALSSRNMYLSAEQRKRAPGMIRGLREGRALVRAGMRDPRAILARVRARIRSEARPDAIDYLALVDPTTLEPLRRIAGSGLLIAAIRIGTTRLLDNLSVTPPSARSRESRN